MSEPSEGAAPAPVKKGCVWSLPPEEVLWDPPP